MWLIALMVWGGGPPADRALATESLDPFGEVARKDAIPVRIHVRNQVSKRLRLVEARVMLDETEVAHETARPGEELERSFSALETVLPPGEHAVRATFVYEIRQDGPAGGEPDRVQVQTAYPFSLAAVREAYVHLVAGERGRGQERKPVLEARSSAGSGVTPLASATTPSGQVVWKSPPP
jgi:hypothetical protein